LECRDQKSADSVLQSMEQKDDDDILVNLCKIENFIAKSDFDKGLQLVQELRDKFEESAKLLSLASSCFMGKREFENVQLPLVKFSNRQRRPWINSTSSIQRTPTK
jgi:uncharacterized protein HemY